jgi:8-oxo-dGTP pyrophosphatase MutT (NUDIX family)
MYKHAYIVAENGKYVVKSESGKNLGTYSTKEQAEKRLEQVEWFKAREKNSHILVTGHSGSGKSTYAKNLANEKGLDLEHLDKHDIMRDIFSQGNSMSGDGSWADKEGDLLKDFLAKRLSEGPERVIEGSQLLHLDSIPKGSRGILIDLPEDRILDQGLRRKLQRMAERGETIDSNVDYSEGRRNIINEYRNKVNKFRQLKNVESVIPELDENLLGGANLSSQYLKTSASAVIVKGNPKYIDNNYDKYYSDIEKELRKAGYSDISFDSGEEGTIPAKADLWLGHSRGASRLRFAPEGTKTLRIDDYENQNKEYNKAVDKLMSDLGASNISEIPIELRPIPGKEHYTMTAKLRDAIRNVKTSEEKRIYRPRATIFLTDKDKILAQKYKWGPNNSTYAFPGGGINPDEDLDTFTPWDRPATAEEAISGASKEALEELGIQLANPRVLGDYKIDIDDPAWREAIKKNWKNNDFHGVHEYYVAANKGNIDKSLLDIHGDQFKGEYYPIEDVIKAVELDSARGLRKATNWGGTEANLGQLNALRSLADNIKTSAEKIRLFHGSPHDVDYIEPREPSRPGNFPGGYTGVYTHPTLEAAAMYALARDKENTRRKWGVTASGKLVALPEMPINDEGYVYEYETDNYIPPPDTQKALGYAILGNPKPIAKHKVLSKDFLDRVIRAKSRESFMDEFKNLATAEDGAVFEEKTASAILRAYELGCDLAIKVAEDGVATKSDPELWSRAKAEAKARMGGKHSARAMQLAVKIYKDRGGDYSGKKPSASQNKMRKWTKQDWQTRPGTDPIAKKEDGSTSRYLPKAKWDSLSKSEQKATDAKKLRSDEQYVENTDAAKVKGNATYIKSSEFAPDYTPEELKAMGVYDQVYGDAPSEASMDKWPAHWLHEQDPLGWLQWYERYSGGRRTEDDARQIKRWESFKARHGSQYASKPTDRRKAALRNWGINADKLVKTSGDVYLTHAVSPDSIESIRKRGLLSAKAIVSDDELLNLARADFSPEKREAWKARVLERLKSDPEAVSGSSVFFNSPDYSKLTPDHNINSRNLKNIRVNISKLLADRPNTRIRGVELVPHNKGKYSDRVRDLSISDVINYTSKTPEELWKDYDPKPGYYAPDVPHAFVLTDDGIIPPEYLDIK